MTYLNEVLQPTAAFVLLGLTNSVFHRPVRYSAFCPGLTITIKLQNIFSTLVLRSAAVAGGDDGMKPPTAQMPGRCMLNYHTLSKDIIVLIPLLFIFLLGCRSYNDQISKLRDGPSANKLREKLKVPIIDSYMIKTDIHSFGSDRWESKEEIPTNGITLHLFKMILPYDKSESSLEEWDAILMKINDSVVHQININSKIKDKFAVTRTGELFIYPLNLPTPIKDRLDPYKKLEEKEIDSILTSWKLHQLVLNN